MAKANTKSRLNQRVLVAMSGGVDSSVAAYLLKEEGYGVIGATMKLFCYGEKQERQKACCSLETINDAKQVCEQLGIPHYVFDMEEEFEREVIEDFVKEYEKGRTPNPCIRCNQLIKFDYLLNKAKELNCDFLATGHYARIANSNQSCHYERSGSCRKPKNPLKLLKGADEAKDQTYFLYRLNQNQLSRIKFPLGELTKKEVRKIAKEGGLKTAEKAESQEICFVDTSVSEFISDKIKVKRGDILDTSDRKMGEHEGVPFYTIGQRKGLGGGFKEPMYVVDIDAAKNAVIVGQEQDLYKKEVFFDDANWISGDTPAGTGLSAVIRYNMKEESVSELKQIQGAYKTIFEKKVRAVTPGQSIVFYSGDECLGGGIIKN